MENEIKLLKNYEKKYWSDIEWLFSINIGLCKINFLAELN